MRVELLVVPECAHEAAAAAVLGTALGDIGLGSVGYTVVRVGSEDDAERRHFVGSPTICVDGQDVFVEPGRPAGLACRLYPCGGGVPELRELRQALKKAAAAVASW